MHPLCMQVLQAQVEFDNKENKQEDGQVVQKRELPLTIRGRILEMNQEGQNSDGHATKYDFLGHLPPASSFIFVEIDMENLEGMQIAPDVLAKFSK